MKRIGLVTVIGMSLLLGGCVVMHDESLSEDEQIEIVKGIMQGYTPKHVAFLQYQSDKNTGFTYITVAIDGKETVLTVNGLDTSDLVGQSYALSPREQFDILKRKPNEAIVMPDIQYLEER